MYLKRIITALTLAATLATATPALAQLSNANSALDTAARGAYGDVGGVEIEDIAGNIIQAFLSLLGVLFLALMVYGGYLWMNARGNEQQVEKAKNLITSAVIGFAIALGAFVITDFIVERIITSTQASG